MHASGETTSSTRHRHLLPPTVTYCPPGGGSAVSYASTEPRPGSGTPGGAGCGDPASTCGAGRQGRGLEGSGWPSRRLPWCPGVRGCEASRAGSPLGPCPTPQGLHQQGDCARRLCSSRAHLSTRTGREATACLWPLQRGDAVGTSQRHLPLAPAATRGLRFMLNLSGFSQKHGTGKLNSFHR